MIMITTNSINNSRTTRSLHCCRKLRLTYWGISVLEARPGMRTIIPRTSKNITIAEAATKAKWKWSWVKKLSWMSETNHRACHLLTTEAMAHRSIGHREPVVTLGFLIPWWTPRGHVILGTMIIVVTRTSIISLLLCLIISIRIIRSINTNISSISIIAIVMQTIIP